ncbi:hypothetical protein M5X00_24105 [Paenibacillus alvei]|uniref:Phage protein n=1 Tax=Paenibacillus alvei TaxID=44250 RepID=A0ABT4GRT7_PAEAL|nr:hypothetical protein [Paenibacillus alvei]MCY9543603.1 hypothetical protein [Paenibacillus alvei]MCY9737327.1 hypothetical protein [Paenibacillus alvei]MCY9757313.1 hypothetical protein [Paenibacillus alvei]MCY9759156.1 hypothetical protein [Paenibacillus alvei]MCY9770385.1 hypothetical protein [Paenibacillus alvei]
MKFRLNAKISVEHTIEFTNDLSPRLMILPDLVKEDTGEVITPKVKTCTGSIQNFNKVEFINIADFIRYCEKYGLSFTRFKCGGAYIKSDWIFNPKNVPKYYRHVILAIREIQASDSQ